MVVIFTHKHSATNHPSGMTCHLYPADKTLLPHDASFGHLGWVFFYSLLLCICLPLSSHPLFALQFFTIALTRSFLSSFDWMIQRLLDLLFPLRGSWAHTWGIWISSLFPLSLANSALSSSALFPPPHNRGMVMAGPHKGLWPPLFTTTPSH